MARISLTVRDRAKRTKIWDHQVNFRCTWHIFFHFFYPKAPKHKMARISLTVTDRAKRTKFWDHQVNFRCTCPKAPKHKMALISLTVRDRAKRTKIWDHQVNFRCPWQIFCPPAFPKENRGLSNTPRPFVRSSVRPSVRPSVRAHVRASVTGMRAALSTACIITKFHRNIVQDLQRLPYWFFAETPIPRWPPAAILDFHDVYRRVCAQP